jgi:hypothetical protein
LESVTTARFRKALDKLPVKVQIRARQVYKIWKKNNNYPSLHFKPIDNESQNLFCKSGIVSSRIRNQRKGDNDLVLDWLT